MTTSVWSATALNAVGNQRALLESAALLPNTAVRLRVDLEGVAVAEWSGSHARSLSLEYVAARPGLYVERAEFSCGGSRYELVNERAVYPGLVLERALPMRCAQLLALESNRLLCDRALVTLDGVTVRDWPGAVAVRAVEREAGVVLWWFEQGVVHRASAEELAGPALPERSGLSLVAAERHALLDSAELLVVVDGGLSSIPFDGGEFSGGDFEPVMLAEREGVLRVVFQETPAAVFDPPQPLDVALCSVGWDAGLAQTSECTLRRGRVAAIGKEGTLLVGRGSDLVWFDVFSLAESQALTLRPEELLVTPTEGELQAGSWATVTSAERATRAGAVLGGHPLERRVVSSDERVRAARGLVWATSDGGTSWSAMR